MQTETLLLLWQLLVWESKYAMIQEFHWETWETKVNKYWPTAMIACRKLFEIIFQFILIFIDMLQVVLDNFPTFFDKFKHFGLILPYLTDFSVILIDLTPSNQLLVLFAPLEIHLWLFSYLFFLTFSLFHAILKLFLLTYLRHFWPFQFLIPILTSVSNFWPNF